MLWITLSVSFNYRRSFKKIKTKIWNWMFDWNWMTNSFQIIFFYVFSANSFQAVAVVSFTLAQGDFKFGCIASFNRM